MVVPSIIFLHYGRADYLVRAVRQARVANPNALIFFLGDEASIPSVLPYAECHDVAQYSAGAAQFLKSYVHMSRDPAQFTGRNIARWFVLRDFCRSRGIASFFHVDSDVLVFAPVESILARFNRAFGAFDVALALASDSYSTCGHASLWLDLDRLAEFCAMVEAIYTLANPAAFLDLVAFHHLPIESGVRNAGLVSDMKLLDMFVRQTTARVVDSNVILEGVMLDHNINLSKQVGHPFKMADGIKRVVWRGDVPHAVLADGGGLVGLAALHCQGRAKQHIRTFTPAIRGDDEAPAIEGTAAPESLVTAAYRVLLGREPDAEGLRAWTDQIRAGLPPLQMLRAFVDSEEFNGLSIIGRDDMQPKRDLVVTLQNLLRQRPH
ncbi:MAG: DUF4214 domain-containing protein [Pseudolabrys sp.]